jgi:nitrogen regulatory protein P-II 2
MKLVIAIFQPTQLPAIKRALKEAGFANLSCTNIIGTVPNMEEHQRFRGVEHEITLFQKIRIEIAVDDESVEPLIDAMIEGGQASGGAGKIFITELYDCVTVKTGERGPAQI